MASMAFVNLTRGHPRYRKDVRRNLRKGSARIAARYGVGRARFTVTRDPAAITALRDEVTAAHAARCAAAGRAFREKAWRRKYRRSREVVTLRIGGKLAAWVLVRPSLDALQVLAGQMVPGFEDLFPGRLVEAFLIARALTEPPRHWWWHRFRPPRWYARRYDVLLWGRGHPETLITAS